MRRNIFILAIIALIFSGCRKEADYQREDDHKHLLADMLHPPFVQQLEPFGSSIVYCFHTLLGTDYTAFIKDTAGFAHRLCFSKRAV